MPVGGARKGAGRKRGGHNKLTQEAVAKARSTGKMPLDYLLDVMRDSAADEARRIDAAKAAAPYCHARLQPIDPLGDTTQKVAVKGALIWQPPQ